MSWSCLSVDTTSISTRYSVHIAIISYQGDHTAANLAGVVNVRRHPCRVNWLTATVGTMTRDCHHLRTTFRCLYGDSTVSLAYVGPCRDTSVISALAHVSNIAWSSVEAHEVFVISPEYKGFMSNYKPRESLGNLYPACHIRRFHGQATVLFVPSDL